MLHFHDKTILFLMVKHLYFLLENQFQIIFQRAITNENDADVKEMWVFRKEVAVTDCSV